MYTYDGIKSDKELDVLGMTPEIQAEHDKLTPSEDILEKIKSEERNPTEEEIAAIIKYADNLIRFKVLPSEFVRTLNKGDSDSDVIDKRFSYGEHIPLICNECGALFSTKNIEAIGRRNIFAYFGGKEDMYKYIALANSCNHIKRHLRLLTDEELQYLGRL